MNQNSARRPETLLFTYALRFTPERGPIPPPSGSGEIVRSAKVREGQPRVSVTDADGCVKQRDHLTSGDM